VSPNVRRALALTAKLERLWADERFDDARRTREFINAWLITRYSAADHDAAFKETLRRIGADRPYGWYGIVSDDAPRYDGLKGNKHRRCPVPKTRGPRAGQPCGGSPAHQTRVTDEKTGEWTLQGWCRQHESHWRTMSARERTLTNVPEPLPNRGGLLPCYIRANNWPDVYVWAMSSWKPPYVGICADDWPVMAKVAKAPLTKVALSALDGGREAAPTGASPALRLVTS
jgi:hypothetical protein